MSIPCPLCGSTSALADLTEEVKALAALRRVVARLGTPEEPGNEELNFTLLGYVSAVRELEQRKVEVEHGGLVTTEFRRHSREPGEEG